jgi:probable HAF family extracellular repeat protein
VEQHRPSGDINDRGQVVGQELSSDWWHLPVLLGRVPPIIKLPRLPGGGWALAFAINNRGQVVGWGEAGGAYHGILWQDGVAIDLGTLPGGSESLATDINERGDIFGSSTDAQVPVR